MGKSALASSVLAIAACDPGLYTEHGQVRVVSNVHFESGKEIVERSRVCTTFDARRLAGEFRPADDAEIRKCYDERIVGPAARDAEGCLRFDEPASVAWELERRPCELAGDFTDDRVAFDVVASEDVRGAFSYAVPLPRELLGAPLEATPLPAGYVAGVGEPIRVIVGTVGSVRATVVRGDAVREVAASDPQVLARIIGGEPTFDLADASRDLVFEAALGDAFAVRLRLPGGDLEVGEVHVVSRDEIVSVEWAPMAVRIADTDDFLGLGAIAVARDAEGRVLREAPATWSVLAGPFALETFDSDSDGTVHASEHASITGACENVRAGTRQSATLEGWLDDFHGIVDVEWTCQEDHVVDGCGCRSTPARPHAFALLALLFALFRPRAYKLRTREVAGSWTRRRAAILPRREVARSWTAPAGTIAADEARRHDHRDPARRHRVS